MGLAGDVDRGTPGGSLLRTYNQRRTAREELVRGRHPHLGGLLLALSDDPHTTLNFWRGAQAEIQVAERLLRRCGPEVELLFNRSLSERGRHGDIDVLAVTSNGVHIVDVKRYANAAVRVRRTGGLLRPATEQLLIKRRDRTSLLDSIERQRDVVRRLVDALLGGESVPLHLAMCFVDADLPLVTQRINGVAILGSKQVARRLNEQGDIRPEVRAALLPYLGTHLPAA